MSALWLLGHLKINLWFYNHDRKNNTKTVNSSRLMPVVQYEYIRKFAMCFLIFENHFIIFKSIFIRAVLKLLLEY